jgi:hypothetical protein
VPCLCVSRLVIVGRRSQQLRERLQYGVGGGPLVRISW